MIRCLVFLLFLSKALFSAAVDFDVVVIGTSPICLLEALYRHHLGNKVLIIERSNVLGGAWKSIDICGIEHVDLGCHTIGHNRNILSFLEEYVGCNMVSMDKPSKRFELDHGGNGFYPSRGCFELISNIERLIEATDIVVLFDHLVEAIWIDENEPVATVVTKEGTFRSSKVLLTPYNCLRIISQNKNIECTSCSVRQYHHIYFLIEDPTGPKFAYRYGGGGGISRMVNLTHFVDIPESYRQLIVLQLNDSSSMIPEYYFQRLKNQGLIDPSATLIKSEKYIYEQCSCNTRQLFHFKNAKTVLEVLTTGDIQSMASYIPKWKNVLKPFQMAIKN